MEIGAPQEGEPVVEGFLAVLTTGDVPALVEVLVLAVVGDGGRHTGS